MALGMYEQDAVHPLNPDMVRATLSQTTLMLRHTPILFLQWLTFTMQRKTLELTGKSRDKGIVQPDVARICNIPHKNFFIVVKVRASLSQT